MGEMNDAPRIRPKAEELTMRSMLAGMLIACDAVGARTAAAAPRPALVVLLSVDQLSAGLFDQYRGRFQGGLRRLVNERVVFPNGYQSHAATETCPGHSTLLTGRHPAGTGIIGNQWYAATNTPEGKRELKKQYCVWDPGSPVPGRPKDPRGPRNLRVTTLGDWMHRADRNSRTVAVSGKDRAAITMAGHDPTGVYWWDNERGFNTYVPEGATEEGRLEPVKPFNEALAARWASQPPEWRVADSACTALSGRERYGALVLDHVVPPPLVRAGQRGPLQQDKGFIKWLRASPVLDELTLDLASRLVDRFALGRRGATDLLAVSLSATDYIGHKYGNQGPEMCDQLAHHWSQSDRPAQALPYLVTAADGAVVVGGNREAIGHLETALRLCAEHPATGRDQANAIRLKLAGLHFIVGER